MAACECSEIHERRRVVLTGGPGAGKTALLELIRQSFCSHVKVLPEAAGVVFGGGFPREDDPSCRRAAQRAIFYEALSLWGDGADIARRVSVNKGDQVRKAFAVVLLTWFAAACGGNSPTAPSGSMATASVAGTWAGIGSDSSSSIGAGSMMGQTDMGTMTWQLTQNGSTVTGPMSFSGSGMPGRMAGSFLGTMSDDDMTFTMDMPTSSMMSPGCSSRATGTAHVNRTTMTMTGTYSGSNSCSGAFANGQMTMTRR